ncbi:MAG TPA: PAS domain S-box protein, partial [Actinomycetes bacterium]|nr:PAS domain S-box protein [Actinomycetes bacterium]
LHAAYAELEASRTRMAALVESALDSIVVMDHHGDVVELNPAAERLFGYPRLEAVGHEMADLLVPPDHRRAHREGLARYLETGEAPLIGVRLEVEATHADGHRIPVELTISRVELPGDPLFLGHLRDLSEQRAAEAERDRLDEQLRQADRLDSLGQLSGGIAHDFNNVLAVILNYASLVQDELPEGPVREDVRAIHEAASRAAGLTRQLLDFSRSDPVTEGELVDVDGVVTAVGRLLGRTLPETIRLVVVPAEVPVHVRGVPSKIEQVVMNLAVNARDAMPAGGTVTITTHLRDVPDDDTPPGLAPGRFVELAVADSGEGMTAGVREHAFEPFFSTKPKGQGTGLGLATVYGIARQAGGTATIRSASGQGTTVSVWLPVALADSAGERAVRPAGGASSTSGSGHVLVVEDEEMLGRALRRVLERAGYSVTDVRSAEDALELDFSDGPDLVVSDVTLPGMSGLELAARVRRLRPQVRVLLMSGYAEPAESTVDADLPLLVKPFSLDTFLAQVDEVLGTVRDRSG